ncbi:TonB-dependent receptor plug domain-containing protein [Lacinutrix neustonica]|uniref:TonB-dependent receptor plug domain-containing protein n=1 Tax=Lacinutrix neustonica TaxID=2980107 RepID=A0A9E8MTI6_9FLAO|nr:TonB-dependent receptor plug domain-containing protein [Lacinutrix neustonica]WAC01207.1 TonB-dependent receptor plug domain-containing protein [Lacinutrix neustonica]
MGKNGRILIFIGVFFLSSVIVFSQNREKEESLLKVIKTLQKQHNVQFNYAEDVVKDIFLMPPSNQNTLAQSLAYLEAQTPLHFTLIDTGFVLVKPKKGIVLCGYIRDKENLMPLSLVTIQNGKSSTVTDENGFFQLTISNEFEDITIRHLGYKMLARTYNQFMKNDCGSIYLRATSQFLSEVIISNFITKGINKISNGSFEIDFSKFDILPGLIDNDVLQSVQSFPGIISVDETVSNINIRGGSHDRNLILWDNIKMYQSGHFFGLISMYNPEITQKVSLLKNGSNVAYTDGVSGTINMQTEQNINTKFKGNIGVNLIDANAFVDAPIGNKSSLQLAARKSISNFVQTPTYTKYFDRISQDTEVETNMRSITNSDKAFDFYDTSLRWLYKITDNDELRVNFITVSNQLVFDENATINAVESSRESRLTQNSIAGGLYYNRRWSDKLQTTFQVYETDYKLKAINANLLDSQRFLQENKVSETSIKLQTDYLLKEGLHLLSGYHFVETGVTNLDDVDTPIIRLLVSEVLRTHALFSQIGYKSRNNNTSFNLGLRFNYIDKFKKQIYEPRLSFSQKFLEHFTFDVLGEFKHQNTSQIINFQNDFLGIEKRRWQLSNNTSIPIIRSKQMSTGISFSRKGWLLSAEGYYKNVEGITTQSQGFQNQYEFVKANGSYQVTGLDVLLRKNISNFNTWLSYSYMDNNYRFPSLEENSFPSNYNIAHAITFGANYISNKLKISTGLNWHTGKSITKPTEDNQIVDGEVNFDTTNKANLKDYLRADISAVYDFKYNNKVKINAGVSIWNVLDKENEINTFYRINGSTVNENSQQSLDITPNAVIRVHF